ncbi:MAG: hypothetical protein K2W86_02395 [Sphingomonas sp.]|nr:hypothetical protein [Sphingomonas sp.]
MDDQQEPIHISEQAASGGASPQGVRIVLGISLVLIIIVFAALFLR